MNRKMLFIFNPLSGKGQIRTKLLSIVDLFVKSGYEVTIYPTQRQHDAYDQVIANAEHFDTIVCSGGDGTLDETVSGMMKIGIHIPLGYIPAGSTNDFANSLKIPKDMLKAAEIAVNGEPLLCDVGKFNDKSFVYVAAFGIFTDVSYQTSQGLKNVLGHAAYIIEGATRISVVPAYHVIVDTEQNHYDDEFIFGMVSNSKFVGGMQNLTGKNVELDDGLFEVTLIRKPKNPVELNEILSCLINQRANSKQVFSFKSKEVRFQFEENIAWTLDGEFGGEYQNVDIKNIQQVIPIRVK
ncbi:MAG: diacylglycerol kinase family lipid kinase [Lachnospiraceae bacterium]